MRPRHSHPCGHQPRRCGRLTTASSIGTRRTRTATSAVPGPVAAAAAAADRLRLRHRPLWLCTMSKVRGPVADAAHAEARAGLPLRDPRHRMSPHLMAPHPNVGQPAGRRRDAGHRTGRHGLGGASQGAEPCTDERSHSSNTPCRSCPSADGSRRSAGRTGSTRRSDDPASERVSAPGTRIAAFPKCWTCSRAFMLRRRRAHVATERRDVQLQASL